MKPIERELRYEADRDLSFAKEIKDTPGCEALDRCIQCATCSGLCPMSIYMDHTPRQIVELVRNGFKNDVLKSNTIWLCTSCYQCQTECPKQIGITDMMYALKSKAIAEGHCSPRAPIPTLAREFYRMVEKNGRLSEGPLVQRLFLKTRPWAIVGMWKLGLRLMRTGRLSMRSERMRHPERLQRVLRALDGHAGGRP